jgi:hypothetical protein
MGRATNDTQMETFTLVGFEEGKLTGRAFILGRTERYMMESGEMDSNTVMVCGKAYTVIVILENGRGRRQMGMAFISGATEIGMRENGKSASNMEWALIYSETETHMLVHM